jgi:hypothetical protein
MLTVLGIVIITARTAGHFGSNNLEQQLLALILAEF